MLVNGYDCYDCEYFNYVNGACPKFFPELDAMAMRDGQWECTHFKEADE